MREIDKIAEGLFEKIRDRFEDVSLGDEKAKATQNPERARFFNFDYGVNGHNHGNITMSLIDETSLKVYFSKNISKDLNEEDRHDWYKFLRELREFARRNLLSFEPRDITRSTLKHRDLKQQAKADTTYDSDEVVSESRLYGTMNRSYESFGPVRIKLAHTKPIMDEAHGARSRNISAVFVENEQGERFRLPFTNLTGARAMARHVSAGGVPTDELGQHITEMVNEMTTLRPFIRGMHRRTFEDTITKEMVESAFGYHGLLKNTLKKIKGKKGYTEYKESFKPALVEDEANLEELKELFVKKTLDERIEQALPLVHKAYTMMKDNKNQYTQQFENWASALAEGTWAYPETEEDKAKLIDWFSQERPVGTDAMDATSALYNLIGDDKLFDRLEQLAEVDPDADARDAVMGWLETQNPQMYRDIADAISNNDSVTESWLEQPVVINGKQVDLRSIELDNVESYDYPKYSDAYADYAEFTDGTPLSDDELEELTDKHGDIINAKAHDMLEDTHGQAIPGGTQNMLATTMENEDSQDDDGGFEAIQSAIIRRIAYSHHELLMKLGPDGVLEAARDIAEFAAPVEEIGTSDVSAWVAQIERDAGIEKEVNEEKDEMEIDPKTGKVKSWSHEGDWKKQTKKKDPVGKIHHMSDVARRRTEKMTKDETLEEAFERALNEETFKKGDSVKCPNGKIGTIQDNKDGYYFIKCEDGNQYAYRQQELKSTDMEEEITMPDNPDYSEYDKPTFQRKGIIPGQPNKTLPGINDKKKPGWVGVDTTKPAYQRQADYEREQARIKQLAGLK
jgi:hypothetical protein